MYTTLFVELPTREGKEIINLEDIILIHANNDTINISLENHEEKQVNLSIGMAEIVFNYPFLIKCHRNYIINIFKIKENLTNTQNIRMINNALVPLSDSYKDRYKQALNGYCKHSGGQAVRA